MHQVVVEFDDGRCQIWWRGSDWHEGMQFIRRISPQLVGGIMHLESLR